jgi:uncharacterized protein (TIGR02996 family)
MSERERQLEAFLAAIQKDRYDEATRRVFADWLEENGYDDEALEQRRWTREKQEAEDWLRELAGRLGQTCRNYDDALDGEVPELWEAITYEDVIQAGYAAVQSGNHFVQVGDMTAANVMAEDSVRELYWKHWQTVTGQAVDDETRQHGVFSCSC